MTRDCRVCGGEGYTRSEPGPCSACGGAGKIAVSFILYTDLLARDVRDGDVVNGLTVRRIEAQPDGTLRFRYENGGANYWRPAQPIERVERPRKESDR